MLRRLKVARFLVPREKSQFSQTPAGAGELGPKLLRWWCHALATTSLALDVADHCPWALMLSRGLRSLNLVGMIAAGT
jgi:hypothetical protein